MHRTIKDPTETQIEKEREKYRGWWREKTEREEREEQLAIDRAVEEG